MDRYVRMYTLSCNLISKSVRRITALAGFGPKPLVCVPTGVAGVPELGQLVATRSSCNVHLLSFSRFLVANMCNFMQGQHLYMIREATCLMMSRHAHDCYTEGIALHLYVCEVHV